MGSREELIQRSIPFLREIKDMTPGAEMEKWLNEKYGENSELYQDLSRLIKIGVARKHRVVTEFAPRQSQPHSRTSSANCMARCRTPGVADAGQPP